MVIFSTVALSIVGAPSGPSADGGRPDSVPGLALGMVDAATGERNLVATAERASAGQGVYQSIVQQFTREGNWRRRSLQPKQINELVVRQLQAVQNAIQRSLMHIDQY